MGAVPFIANTDEAWFDFLSERGDAGRVDEANFWSPLATRPMADLEAGTPVFFRLKSPRDAIAGYGFFVLFDVLTLDTAWSLFEWKNGDPDIVNFLRRIGGYRGRDLLRPTSPPEVLGCTILRDLHLWSSERWIPWGVREGWQRNIVRGKSERDEARAALLHAAIRSDAAHEEVQAEFAPRFVPYEEDERRYAASLVVDREGQGTFRARVLSAYGRRCAIIGERTEIVVDAAHIQPYQGPRSNHVQNGIALTQEFHTLFDQGYVGITPDYVVRVSPAIRSRWSNGRRYYEYQDKPLLVLPRAADQRPSREALELHMGLFRTG